MRKKKLASAKKSARSGAVLALASCVLIAVFCGPGACWAAAHETVAARTDEVLAQKAWKAIEDRARHMAQSENFEVAMKQGRARITIAVSTSLAADYRLALKEDAERAGLRLAVRGLPVSSGFEKRAYFAADDGEKKRQKSEIVRGAAFLHEAFGSVDVDPVFFRTHGIEQVPVFVLEDDAGVIARVHGAVSTAYALERLYAETSDSKRAVNRRIGDERLKKAQKEIVRAGCELKRAAPGDFSFMGRDCE